MTEANKNSTNSDLPRLFVPLTDGLGAEDAYYHRLRTMLAALLGRIVAAATICYLLFGLYGAMIAGALVFLFGCRDIYHQRMKNFAGINNNRRIIFSILLITISPIFISIIYYIFGMMAPEYLFWWFDFVSPMLNLASARIPTFDRMREVYSVLYPIINLSNTVELYLSLHIRLLNWLIVPILLIFNPILAFDYKFSREITDDEAFRYFFAFLIFVLISYLYFFQNSFYLGVNENKKSQYMEFGFLAHFFSPLKVFPTTCFVSALFIICTNMIFCYFIPANKIGRVSFLKFHPPSAMISSDQEKGQ